MKKILILLAFFVSTAGYAQTDTVIISLGRTSKIVFTMEDRNDLEVLKHYNFQQLFSDILFKLEQKDKERLSANDSTGRTDQPDEVKTTQRDPDPDFPNANDNDADQDDGDEDREQRRESDEEWSRHDETEDKDDDDDDDEWREGRKRWNRTWQTFNFDLGTNNYLSDGKFPDDSDLYAVRPWGSWYVGLASVQRSRLAKNFFLEWGLGLSWYTFKFQNDNVVLVKDDNGVRFENDLRDLEFVKSKLSASYIQASLIPVLDFNDHGKKSRVWEGYKDSFRIGVGPYVAYRISSHSKLVYKDEGRERDKDRDSFYLNNLRYGARLQVGYRSTDLFFNYDLNELFKEGKGPNLNAFSFGVIF